MYEKYFIPLDKLTEEQTRVIDRLIGEFYSAGQLEIISTARTEKMLKIAQEEGFDAISAKKLAAHFNAATEIIGKMPPAMKKAFDVDLARKAKESGFAPPKT
jgi:hypothetical protein